MKLSHIFIENDIDNLKLACAYYESQKEGCVLEGVFNMYFKAKKGKILKDRFKDVMKAFELLFPPIKVFRGMTALIRKFYHKGEGKEILNYCFNEILDALDFFIEAKNDALEQEIYYLFEKKIDFCQKIEIDFKGIKEQDEYSFGIMVMGKRDQCCTVMRISHELNKGKTEFSIEYENENLILKKNRKKVIKTLVVEALMKNYTIFYTLDRKEEKVKFFVNGNQAYEESMPKELIVGLKKIEILENFSGRFLHFIEFDTCSNQVFKDLFETIPQGIQTRDDKLKLMNMFKDEKINMKIFSRIVQKGVKFKNTIIPSNWVVMGKTIEERNLSLSPGLGALLPFFTYLKFSKKNEMYENLRKLLVLSGVVISQIESSYIDQDILDFPISLKMIILVDSGISNLFFLIYQNCINLDFRGKWLEMIISEWNFYSWMNEVNFKNVILQFFELFSRHSLINHYNILESILLFLNKNRLKPSTVGSIKYKKLNRNTLNPLNIYKEFFKPKKKINLIIVHKILLAFSELLRFKNSPKVEIFFLTIFKKIVEKLSEKNFEMKTEDNDEKLTVRAVEKICSSLILKFKGGKLETKNVVMQILGLLLTKKMKNEIKKNESNLEKFDKIFTELSGEINFFFKKNIFERSFLKIDEGSNLTSRDLTKNGSFKSHLSEILTPSKHSSTPKGVLLSGQNFKRKKKFGEGKIMNLNLDMATINETPKGEKNNRIFKNPPKSMKHAERKNFEFSNSVKLNSTLNLNKKNFCLNNKFVKESGQKKIVINPEKNGRKIEVKKVKNFRSKRKEFLKKKQLTLDTEEINKLFNFGGEKGRKFANEGDDEILREKIDQLAQEVVDFMENGDEEEGIEFKAPEKRVFPLKLNSNLKQEKFKKTLFIQGHLKSAPQSRKGAEKKIMFGGFDLKKDELKIITERSLNSHSKHSKSSKINSKNPEKEYLKSMKQHSYLHPQKIFQMKYHTPRSNSTTDNFLSQKTVQNYIDLLTMKTVKISTPGDGAFDLNLLRKKSFVSGVQMKKKKNINFSHFGKKYSSTKNKGSKGIFVFNFTPKSTRAQKRKNFIFGNKKEIDEETKKIELLNSNLLSSLHTIIKISPNQYKSKLCSIATKIMKNCNFDAKIWKNLIRLFYEILWEYYSPELNKVSLEDVPHALSSKNKSVFSRSDLSQFILVYVTRQVKFGNLQDSRKLIQLLFTMNMLKSKMFSSSIGMNPSMMTILDKIERSFKKEEFCFEPFTWKKVYHYFFMRFLERLKLVKHTRLQVMSDELFVINRYNWDSFEKLMNNFEEVQILDKMINYRLKDIQKSHRLENEKVQSYEITFKPTAEVKTEDKDYFIKEIFESDVDEKIIENMVNFIESSRFKNNQIEEIFNYQDESIQKVARRMNLIEFIVVYTLSCMNNSIKQFGVRRFEEGEETFVEMLKTLLKYLKLLIFYFEFSEEKNSGGLPNTFKSPTANSSCLSCCLLISYSSLSFFYKKLKNSKNLLANNIKSSLKDLTEFIGNSLLLKKKLKPGVFQQKTTSKPKRRIGGFFGSEAMNSDKSILKDFCDGYFKITIYNPSPQKEGQFTPELEIKKKKFNLQIRTELHKEKSIFLFKNLNLEYEKYIQISEYQLEGILTKSWLNEPKSKRIMDRMKFNFVEFSREFWKFKIDSLKKAKQDIQNHFEPKRSSSELIQAKKEKLKIILNRIIDNPKITPLHLNQSLNQTLLNHPEWAEKNDGGIKSSVKEGGELSRNYLFEEMPILSDMKSFPLVRKKLYETGIINELFNWKLGKIHYYLKIKEVENILDKDFFNDKCENYFLSKNCKILITGISTSTIGIVSSKRLIFIIFEIPKVKDSQVHNLEELKDLKRFKIDGEYKGLDVTLINNFNFLLEFESETDQHEFSKKLVRLRKQGTSNLNYQNTLNPKSLFKISSFKNKWIKGKLSNFEYLSAINSFSSRSNHDKKFHPIVPNVIIENEGGISGRILDSLEETKKDSNENFEELENKNINFLLRKYPYSQIEMGNMPLKTIANIHIPENCVEYLYSEFASEPSFLLKTPNLDHVKLPEWVKDPFKYVYLQRKVLESDVISSSLNFWIDDFFGVNAKVLGEERKNKKISKSMKGSPSSGSLKRGNLCKMRLFEGNHPKKDPENLERRFGFKGFKLKMYEPNEENFSDGIGGVKVKENKNEISILKIIRTDSQVLVTVSQKMMTIMKFSNQSKNPKLGILSEIELDRIFFNFQNIFFNADKHLELLWKNRTLLYLRHKDQIEDEKLKKIIFFYFNSSQEKTRKIGNFEFEIESEIKVFKIFSEENFIVIGTQEGSIASFKINQKYRNLSDEKKDYRCKIQYIKTLGQPSLETEINCLEILENLNTVTVGNLSGEVFILNLMSGDLITRVQSNTIFWIDRAVFLTDPFSFVLIFSSEANIFTCLNFLNEIIDSFEPSEKIRDMKILDNKTHTKKLVTLNIKGEIHIYSIPYFEEIQNCSRQKNFNSSTFEISSDNSSIFIANQDNIILCLP